MCCVEDIAGGYMSGSYAGCWRNLCPVLVRGGARALKHSQFVIDATRSYACTTVTISRLPSSEVAVLSLQGIPAQLARQLCQMIARVPWANLAQNTTVYTNSKFWLPQALSGSEASSSSEKSFLQKGLKMYARTSVNVRLAACDPSASRMACPWTSQTCSGRSPGSQSKYCASNVEVFAIKC